MKRLKALGLSVLVAGQVGGAGCGNDHGPPVTPIESVSQRLAAPAPAPPSDALLEPGVAQIAILVKDAPTGLVLGGVVASAAPSAQVSTTGGTSAVLSVPFPAGQPPERIIVWLQRSGYEPSTHVVLVDHRGIGSLVTSLVPKTGTLAGRIELASPRPDIDLARVQICTCGNPVATFSSVVRSDGSFELRGLPLSNDQILRGYDLTFKHPALRTLSVRRTIGPESGSASAVRMEPL